jgi:hypothetical protein
VYFLVRCDGLFFTVFKEREVFLFQIVYMASVLRGYDYWYGHQSCAGGKSCG